MKAVLLYIIQMTAVSGMLYAYYHVFLRNRKLHSYNRYYLLLLMAVSMIIPFLSIPVYLPVATANPSGFFHTLAIISTGKFEEGLATNIASADRQPGVNWDRFAMIAYMIVAALFFCRTMAAVLNIRKLMRRYPRENIGGIDFFNTNEPGTPFSFFRLLFWNREIAVDSAAGKQIFRHELFHIRQKHSCDIMLAEILSAICWLNPFFYFARKELAIIHEFQADRAAAVNNEEWEYAELLVMQMLGTPNNRLITPFFHNQVKRRITMITSPQKNNRNYFRKLLALPIAALLLVIFSFTYKGKPVGAAHAGIPESFTIVIDAGHGGKSGAVAADGTYEDDLALSIAQKVKALNTNKDLHIVLTRESKEAVDLRQRSSQANSQHPALFLSIHLNNTTEIQKNGFDVFISRKNQLFETENKAFAGILLNHFSTLYPAQDKIQQQNEGIWVLDNSDCPAALIECGYLSNIKDLAFIKLPANQEKIAKNILQSVEEFIAKKESAAKK